MSSTAPITAPAGLAAQLAAGNPPPGTFTAPANPSPAAPQVPPTPPAQPQPVTHPAGLPNPFPALPQVPAQPVPAPAEPAKPEPKPASKAEPNPVKEQNEAMLAEVKDPQLKLLGNLLRTSVPTLDIDRALGKAIEEGRDDLIDRAYIQEAAGENAGAVTELARQIVQAAQTLAVASAQKVYAAAGGEAQWRAATTAFNASAPAHLKAAAKALLDNGQMEEGAALVMDFVKTSGALPSGGAHALALPGNSGVQGGLSREEFQREFMKLDRSSPSYAQDRDALIQRRSVGKAAGL